MTFQVQLANIYLLVHHLLSNLFNNELNLTKQLESLTNFDSNNNLVINYYFVYMYAKDISKVWLVYTE